MKFELESRELKELFISTVIIAFCFTWVIDVKGLLFLVYFLIMFIIVGLAFVLHEIAHKYVAIKFGLEARFRAWYLGLAIAVALALTIKFFFIAPGAVQIHSVRYITRSEEGKIAIAGVLTNIFLSIIFVLLYMITFNPIFKFGAIINAWLAFINLLPFPPLDGSKVLFWNPILWLVSIIFSFFLYLYLK